ncbi:MAG TPA: hypothetical protein VND96_10975 [Candidatus Micrarchaeaceae archaeon]|nr:hypothetical protein [Candidatus Micrarchaeaceae archaeon]
MGQTQEEYYRDVRMVPYDLIKELAIAMAAIGILAVLLAAFLSSPDIHPVTIATWSQADPVDFVTTATGELAGTTTSAGYGAPYNSTPDAYQHWGPFAPQAWFGVRIPIDSANAYVIEPLKHASLSNSTLGASLSQWQAATSDQQAKWLDAYTTALAAATVTDGTVTVASGDYGPLPSMMSNLLGVAQSGGLDGLLVTNGRFYQTDYTQPLLFIGDGGWFAGLAANQHLSGDLWGMMNETGLYPGQTWLWLYTMWYQVPPFTSDTGFLGLNAHNADLGIIIVMTVLTFLLALVPFIPILRDIPRWLPIHRVIWRAYYAPKTKASGTTGKPVASAAPPSL